MKDATGELSTTVIAIVAIAAIAGIFTVFLLPQLRSSIILGQACSQGPGYNYTQPDNSYSISCNGTVGHGGVGASKNWTCTYTESGSTQNQKKQCSS